MEKIYTATTTASGGRSGHVHSPDNVVNFDMRLPKAMGGPEGHYLNPELLFAAGYSACFDSALNRIIGLEKVQTGATSVTAHVSIGRLDTSRFGLAVDLEISIPGVGRDVAEDLAGKAHEICPYSNATRGNVQVNLIVRN